MSRAEREKSIPKTTCVKANRTLDAVSDGAFAATHHGLRRFLNCGLPRLSSEQISPSMTALTFGRESEIDSASAEKEVNG